MTSLWSGVVALDWLDDTIVPASSRLPLDAPVVLCLPGVHGVHSGITSACSNRLSVSDTYLRRFFLVCRNNGLRAVAKSWRGLGVELVDSNTETWGTVCMNFFCENVLQESVADLEAAVDHVKAKYPQSKLFVVLQKTVFSIGCAGWMVDGWLRCRDVLWLSTWLRENCMLRPNTEIGSRNVQAALCVSSLFTFNDLVLLNFVRLDRV
jgi:hypothetical protein